MRRAVIYLRVSTIEQTTANQERELREIAGRMGCETVNVYKDHGISGTRDATNARRSTSYAVTRRGENSIW
jgi:DNA invertase Pin-like site-specific DNA recombinase